MNLHLPNLGGMGFQGSGRVWPGPALAVRMIAAPARLPSLSLSLSIHPSMLLSTLSPGSCPEEVKPPEPQSKAFEATPCMHARSKRDRQADTENNHAKQALTIRFICGTVLGTAYTKKGEKKRKQAKKTHKHNFGSKPSLVGMFGPKIKKNLEFYSKKIDTHLKVGAFHVLAFCLLQFLCLFLALILHVSLSGFRNANTKRRVF